MALLVLAAAMRSRAAQPGYQGNMGLELTKIQSKPASSERQ